MCMFACRQTPISIAVLERPSPGLVAGATTRPWMGIFSYRRWATSCQYSHSCSLNGAHAPEPPLPCLPCHLLLLLQVAQLGQQPRWGGRAAVPGQCGTGGAAPGAAGAARLAAGAAGGAAPGFRAGAAPLAGAAVGPPRSRDAAPTAATDEPGRSTGWAAWGMAACLPACLSWIDTRAGPPKRCPQWHMGCPVVSATSPGHPRCLKVTRAAFRLPYCSMRLECRWSTGLPGWQLS